MIVIMLAKVMYRSIEYTRCFELLQRQYTELPTYTSLLYLYGKYVIKTMDVEIKQRDSRSNIRDTTFMKPTIDSGYLGSGIGALEECTRTCF